MKTCMWCGGSFDGWGCDGRFCSERCRADYNWEHGGRAAAEEESKKNARLEAEKEARREKEENNARIRQEREAHAREEAIRKQNPARWYGYEWVDHLKRNPADDAKCNWSLFKHEDWIHLLCCRPEFADKCPKGKWNEFKGALWAELLKSQPRFVERCPWDKIKTEKSVLSELLAIFPDRGSPDDWSKIEVSDWGKLLHNQPKLACHCTDWSSVEFKDVVACLKLDPAVPEKSGFKGMTSETASLLLESYPELAKYLSIDNMNSRQLRKIWRRHPQLLKDCRFVNWAAFDGDDLNEFLSNNPDFIPLVSSDGVAKLRGSQHSAFLRKYPETMCNDAFLQLKNLDPEQIIHFVTESFGGFTPVAWQGVLATYDRFTEKQQNKLVEFLRGKWGDLPDNERVGFAIKIEGLADEIVGEVIDPNRLQPLNLFWALDKWPEKCKDFDADSYNWSQCDKDPTLWARLTFFHPEFRKYCDPSKVNWLLLEKETDMRFWAWALAGCPDEVINHFQKWKKIQEDWWPQLVERQPKLAPYRDKYCPAKKSITAAPQTPQPKEVPMASKEKGSEEVPAKKSENQNVRSKSSSTGRKQGLIKRYWMPTLAVLLILSAFDEGGVASFVIGAGLGAFWWWKKRKA